MSEHPENGALSNGYMQIRDWILIQIKSEEIALAKGGKLVWLCHTNTHTQTHAHKKKVSFYLPICLPFLTQQPAAAARGHLGTDKQPTIDSITCHVARQKDLGGLPINSEINLCAKRFRFRGKNASYFHEFYPFLTPSFSGFFPSFIFVWL